MGEVSILSSSLPWVRHSSPGRLPGHSRPREGHSVFFLKSSLCHPQRSSWKVLLSSRVVDSEEPSSLSRFVCCFPVRRQDGDLEGGVPEAWHKVIHCFLN